MSDAEPTTQSCRACGGSGNDPDPPQPIFDSSGNHDGFVGEGDCHVCRGRGRVPASWWWDERGDVHTRSPEEEAWIAVVQSERARRLAEAGDRPDGFRPRRIRPKGWLEKAIKNGSVRDPNAPDPDAGKDYSGAVVVRPPTATVTGDADKE